ncbi:MAG: methylmalonic aciduria and homocystinuria type D protein [Cyanobacteria bacterium P01_A01_bin.135]
MTGAPSGLIPTGDGLDWSTHPPSSYILRHWGRILPDWSGPVQSVIILLQRAPLPRWGRGAPVELAKARLRDRALALGSILAAALSQQGYQTAVFDPRTGLPLATTPGAPLDDVAVAQYLLGYRTEPGGYCTCLLHPRWGGAVYPSTLLSTALPHQIDGLPLIRTQPTKGE